MAAFPTSLPIDEIKAIIDIVRTGAVSTRMSEFTLNCWWCSGYALRMVGNTTEPTEPTINIMSAEDPVAVLEKVVAMHENVSAQMAIPWAIVLQWALNELIKLVIKK